MQTAVSADKRSGRRVFFNAVVAVFLGWNDKRNRGPDSVHFGDGSRLDEADVRAVDRIMQEIKVAVPWQKARSLSCFLQLPPPPAPQQAAPAAAGRSSPAPRDLTAASARPPPASEIYPAGGHGPRRQLPGAALEEPVRAAEEDPRVPLRVGAAAAARRGPVCVLVVSARWWLGGGLYRSSAS